jgi:hypothetical protein
MQAALTMARVALEEKSLRFMIRKTPAASNRFTRAVRGGEANRFAAQ